MSKSKYPCVYKDGPNKFYYHVDLGTDPFTGKRIQKMGRRDDKKRPFTRAKDCYNHVLKLKKQYLESQGIFSDDIRLNEFIDRKYLPNYKNKVQKSTYNNRLNHIKIIKDFFNNKKLKEITKTDCSMFIDHLLHEKNYKASYAAMVYDTFKRIIKYAIKEDVLYRDVTDNDDKKIQVTRSKVAFWTKDEFEKVLQTFYLGNTYQHMGFIIVWLYFNTGIRVGEGQALTWDKVNFKAKTLTIDSNMVMKSTKEYYIKETKTNSGMRNISLDDKTINYLNEWKKVQEKLGIDNFIISHNGNPVSRGNIGRILKRHAKLADVHPIQPKGLRHSHASYLINYLNADLLVVSHRLGHSGPDVTLRYYSHMWPGNDALLAKKLTRDINVSTTKESLYKFNGNQSVKN